MFILRKLTDDSEANVCLGETYNYVDKLKHPEVFNKTLNLWCCGVIHPDYDKIYAFLLYGENLSKAINLYDNQRNYLMTSDGQTFSNLTFKYPLKIKNPDLEKFEEFKNNGHAIFKQ